MLQSIPDPFDSYGPPKPEDQIFSILPPLSIFGGNQPSPSPSPQSATTEIDHTNVFAPNTSGMSWASAPSPEQDQPPYGQSDWAFVRTPTSSPPQSIRSSSTARPTSPPGSSRRANSYPSASGSSSSGTGTQSQTRKSEAKLRKVLSVIDERERAPSELGDGQVQDSNSDIGDHAQEASAESVDTVTEQSYTTTMNGHNNHESLADSPHWGSLESAKSKDFSDESDSHNTPLGSRPPEGDSEPDESSNEKR